MKSKYTGISRIIHAFKYSFDGISSAFKSEAAFRQDILLCITAIIVQSFFDIPTTSRIIMIASLLLIIIAELVNTAIETIVDRISPQKHELSKKAKDIGSAIVMLTIFGVAALWISLIYVA